MIKPGDLVTVCDGCKVVSLRSSLDQGDPGQTTWSGRLATNELALVVAVVRSADRSSFGRQMMLLTQDGFGWISSAGVDAV